MPEAPGEDSGALEMSKGSDFQVGRSVVGIAAALLVAAFLGTSRAGMQEAQGLPLYDGLPERLPADYLAQSGFLPFDHDPDHGSAPIVSMLLIDGQPTSGGIFKEKLWVRIPEGSKIGSRTSSGVDVWTYPVGTESMHEIDFDTPGSEPFELRTVRLLPEGRWAFGAYRFDGQGYVLNTATAAIQESVDITFRGNARPSRVEFKRINIRSCQGCHHMNAVKEQFPTRDSAGPCAFVSWNPAVLERWAKQFEQQMGYAPIVRE